jgi:Na+/glutamate symporter
MFAGAIIHNCADATGLISLSQRSIDDIGTVALALFIAMASMESLTERYGPAPRAFLVVPIVGAFFIDFTNAVIITLFLNILS